VALAATDRRVHDIPADFCARFNNLEAAGK
jgi:hypothetical protein